MKTFLTTTSMIGLTLLLSSCLYTKPVFTEDFTQIEESLTGVWVTEEKGDPRTIQYAVCVPIDDDRYLLHHPARSQDSFYYEARTVKRRDRTLLQLRVLSTFKGGPPKPESKKFTLLWIQPQADGSLLMRPADGKSSLSRMTAAEARKILEDPSSDWDTLFGQADAYRRLR